MSNSGSRLRNTANIHFKDYDHKDVIAVWNDGDGTAHGSPAPPRDHYAAPNCVNQIVVVDEEGEAHRIWSKIYDELLLHKSPYFWLTMHDFFLWWSFWSYSNDYLTGFLFPEYYKNVNPCTIMPWEIHGFASGPTGTYSIKNSLLIGARGWGYGSGNFVGSRTNNNNGKYIVYEDLKDHFCEFTVTPDGINSYRTTKIKLKDKIGWKARAVGSWRIVKHGFYYFYSRLKPDQQPGNEYGDGKSWISYMSFDRETKHFGDPVDFNINMNDLLNIPEGSSFTGAFATLDDYLFYFNQEDENPNNDRYLYRSRIHFIRIGPTGDVRHFYTRWYAAMTYFPTNSYNHYITSDENYIYFNMVTQNVYTQDNSCPKMASIFTVDKNCNINIILSERFIMNWNPSYSVWDQLPTKIASIINMSYVYKNDHSNWWYFYQRVAYNNPAFSDFDDYNPNDSYYTRWIVARTTDFIHFEFYQTPKETITYHSQMGNLSKKVTYKSENAKPGDDNDPVYMANMVSYNPEPLQGDMSSIVPICIHNGRFAHTSGHFIKTENSNGMWAQGYIYLKNYACMPKDDDVWLIYYNSENCFSHWILDLINGIDSQEGGS